MPQTVLIVDDEAEIRALVGKILRAEGFEALEAANGDQMLRTLAARRPDLILLDVMLPELDGYELCRRVKQDPATRAIPVVLLTVLATAASLRKGLDAGASAYLTKPFDPTVLGEKIRALIDQTPE